MYVRTRADPPSVFNCNLRRISRLNTKDHTVKVYIYKPKSTQGPDLPQLVLPLAKPLGLPRLKKSAYTHNAHQGEVPWHELFGPRKLPQKHRQTKASGGLGLRA